MTLLVYWPALHGQFIWDDIDYIQSNPAVTEAHWLDKIWTDYRASPQYYPLVFTTFWLEYRIWGDHTIGYHLVNVGLHILNAVLLWRVLRRFELPGAFCAACFFAAHPVNVESVAWITERKNVLSGCFYFLALSRFIHWRGLDAEKAAKAGRARDYALCLVFFVAALLSKTISVTLPPVLLLLIWWRKGAWRRSDFMLLAPMFLLAVGMGLVTIAVERFHVGASDPTWAVPVFERIIIASRALCFYVTKLIAPCGLAFIYPRWSVDAVPLSHLAFPVTVLIGLFCLWLGRRTMGRGPFTAVMCFIIGVFPTLGLFPIYFHRYSFVADHFLYHAAPFFIIGVVAAACRLLRHATRKARVTLGSAIVIALALFARNRAADYRDPEKLWTDTIAKNSSAWMAYGNLAGVLAAQDRLDEAVEQTLKGLKIYGIQPRAYYNLALAYEKFNRLDDAEAAYRTAITQRDVDDAPHGNLGCLLSRRERLPGAERELREAVRLAPRKPEWHYNLGIVLAQAGRLEEARRSFAEAIRLRPEYWAARINDSGAAWKQGHKDEAIAICREVTLRQPDNPLARFNLGVMLIDMGRKAEGIEMLQEVLKLAPDDDEIRIRMIPELIALRRFAEARTQLDRLKHRRANDPEIASMERMLNDAMRR